jgi:hypothetical protein
MSEMSVLLMAVGAAVGATAFLHALDKYARDRQFGANTVPSERQMLLDRVKELESQVQFLLNQLQAACALARIPVPCPPKPCGCWPSGR